MIPRPGQVVVTSNNFASTNSSYSAHSSTPGRHCYSTSISSLHSIARLTRYHSQYLENLCDYLYDDLRPRILHEPRVSVLCDVCTVIQALMVLDVPNVESDEEDEAPSKHEDDDGFIPSRKRPKGLRRLHISRLLQMVLQDAQTRLFFKAQSIIQAEIRYYVPKPEDLAYPDKLVGALDTRGLRVFCLVDTFALSKRSGIHCPVGASNIQKRSTSARSSRSSPLINRRRGTRLCRRRCGYCPSFMTLSRFADSPVSPVAFNNRLQPAIFEDIAQEAINICRHSLVSAAAAIKGVKANAVSQGPGQSYATSKMFDGELFLVRHLLILKEVTQNLDLVGRDSASRTVDLSAVTGALCVLRGLWLM